MGHHRRSGHCRRRPLEFHHGQRLLLLAEPNACGAGAADEELVGPGEVPACVAAIATAKTASPGRLCLQHHADGARRVRRRRRRRADRHHLAARRGHAAAAQRAAGRGPRGLVGVGRRQCLELQPDGRGRAGCSISTGAIWVWGIDAGKGGSAMVAGSMHGSKARARCQHASSWEQGSWLSFSTHPTSCRQAPTRPPALALSMLRPLQSPAAPSSSGTPHLLPSQCNAPPPSPPSHASPSPPNPQQRRLPLPAPVPAQRRPATPRAQPRAPLRPPGRCTPRHPRPWPRPPPSSAAGRRQRRGAGLPPAAPRLPAAAMPRTCCSPPAVRRGRWTGQ